MVADQQSRPAGVMVAMGEGTLAHKEEAGDLWSDLARLVIVQFVPVACLIPTPWLLCWDVCTYTHVATSILAPAQLWDGSLEMRLLLPFPDFTMYAFALHFYVLVQMCLCIIPKGLHLGSIVH